MTGDDDALASCVLIPCSADEIWAVPQICLAEILTVHTEDEQPPSEVEWRGRSVPVMDFGAQGSTPWQSSWRGSGLVAIFLGLAGEGCEYWGVAVRGDGLAAEKISVADVEDVPDQRRDYASAAFRFRDMLCQVPDLDGLQKQAAGHATA